MKKKVFNIIFISFYISLTATLTDSCSRHVTSSGKVSIDAGLLINNWTQGKIDQTGKVVQADIKRGGWYQLNINSDTAIFSDPLNCGFGHERQGTWTLNKMDTTVTFTFSKSVGYGNTPGTNDIKEIEIYKIVKLTTGELILKRTVDGNETTMPFVKTNK